MPLQTICKLTAGCPWSSRLVPNSRDTYYPCGNIACLLALRIVHIFLSCLYVCSILVKESETLALLETFRASAQVSAFVSSIVSLLQRRIFAVGSNQVFLDWEQSHLLIARGQPYTVSIWDEVQKPAEIPLEMKDISLNIIRFPPGLTHTSAASLAKSPSNSIDSAVPWNAKSEG